MKKIFALLVLALLIIAGCSSNSSSDSGSSNSSGGSDSGSGSADEISVAMVAGTETAAIKQLVPQFEEETGIKVNLNEFNYDTLYERIYNDLRSNGGVYDVVFADDPWMPMFAGGGFLTPLDELGFEVEDDFAETSRKVSMWPAPEGPRLPGSDPNEEPRFYGVPSVGNVQMLFYRKDLMEEPETWADVENAIKEHAGKDIEYGFIHRGARGNGIATNFNAFLWSHGADFFDEDWNVTVNSPEAIEALEFYLSMRDTAPDGVANYNADEIGRVMVQGEGLLSIVWPSWAPEMEKEGSSVKGKIGYTLVPKAEGNDHAPMIGNWIMAIPEVSEKKEAALQFIEWANSKEIQKEAVLNGGVPTRTSVLTDPELLEEYPYLDAIAEGLNNANFRPRTPLYSQIESIYGTALNQAMTDDLTAKEALDKAAAEIEKLMEDNGYYK